MEVAQVAVPVAVAQEGPELDLVQDLLQDVVRVLSKSSKKFTSKNGKDSKEIVQAAISKQSVQLSRKKESKKALQNLQMKKAPMRRRIRRVPDHLRIRRTPSQRAAFKAEQEAAVERLYREKAERAAQLGKRPPGRPPVKRMEKLGAELVVPVVTPKNPPGRPRVHPVGYVRDRAGEYQRRKARMAFLKSVKTGSKKQIVSNAKAAKHSNKKVMKSGKKAKASVAKALNAAKKEAVAPKVVEAVAVAKRSKAKKMRTLKK